MMVLALHSHLAVQQTVTQIPFLSDFGWLGVRLFFVISGFIIAERISHESSFSRYAVKRFLRVFPLYLLVTLAAIALRAGVGVGDFTSAETDSGAAFDANAPFYLIKSLLIIPQDNWPILMVGWSLEYELVFYLLFGAAWFIGGRMAALIVMALVSAAGLIAPDLTRPILDELFAYFLFGCLAREALARLPGGALRVAPLVFIVCSALSALALYQLILTPWVVFVLISGAGFAALLIWWVDAERRGTAFQRANWVTRLGDMSFTIYLVHWLVVAVIRDLTGAAGLSVAAAEGLRVAIVPLSLTASWVVWRWVETPLNRWTGRVTRVR